MNVPFFGSTAPDSDGTGSQFVTYMGSYLGLLLFLGLINFLVLLCLVIGLFVTVPVTFLATMSAYEQIFQSRAPGSR